MSWVSDSPEPGDDSFLLRGFRCPAFELRSGEFNPFLLTRASDGLDPGANHGESLPEGLSVGSMDFDRLLLSKSELAEFEFSDSDGSSGGATRGALPAVPFGFVDGAFADDCEEGFAVWSSGADPGFEPLLELRGGSAGLDWSFAELGLIARLLLLDREFFGPDLFGPELFEFAFPESFFCSCRCPSMDFSFLKSSCKASIRSASAWAGRERSSDRLRSSVLDGLSLRDSLGESCSSLRSLGFAGRLGSGLFEKRSVEKGSLAKGSLATGSFEFLSGMDSLGGFDLGKESGGELGTGLERDCRFSLGFSTDRSRGLSLGCRRGKGTPSEFRGVRSEGEGTLRSRAYCSSNC